MEISERLVTSDEGINKYIWEIIKKYSCSQDENYFNVNMVFYDMNGQSNTSITFSNDSSSVINCLEDRCKTNGMMSPNLVNKLIEKFINNGLVLNKISYDNISLYLSFGIQNKCLEYDEVGLNLHFPTIRNKSVLLTEFLYYIVSYNKSLFSTLISMKEIENISRRYHQEKYINSLTHSQIKKFLNLIEDDDICELLSYYSFDKFTYIKKQFEKDDEAYTLSRKKAI